MATKAKLKVVLMADSLVVEESEDMSLWHKVLGIIQSGNTPTYSVGQENGEAPVELDQKVHDDKAITGFSKTINVPVKIVQGAISPSIEPPYLHLNHHNWAAMKKNTPKRGSGAINPTGLASTLLALWVKEAKIDVPPTQALAMEILETIDVKDKNPSRGIKNTGWLQGRRGGVVVINPAEIAEAIEVARSFCTKQWDVSAKKS